MILSKCKFLYGDLVQIEESETKRYLYSIPLTGIVIKGARAHHISNQNQYGLVFKGGQQMSWFDEDQLTLITPAHGELLIKWVREGGDE